MSDNPPRIAAPAASTPIAYAVSTLPRCNPKTMALTALSEDKAIASVSFRALPPHFWPIQHIKIHVSSSEVIAFQVSWRCVWPMRRDPGCHANSGP